VTAASGDPADAVRVTPTPALDAPGLDGADNQRIGNAHSQQEILDRGVGLDLLGKLREQE